MRKSSLILLLAMAFVLTTVAAGFSDDTVIEGPCTELCEKCWGYGLHINSNYDEGSEDQYSSVDAEPCPLFDFESSLGYCGNNKYKCKVDETTTIDGYYNAPGVVFKVCDCIPEVTFEVGHSYGIKLEILDSNGVYFTDQNYGSHFVDLMSNDTCNDFECGASTEPAIYVGALGDTTDNGTFCPVPCDATVFKMGYKPLSDDKVLYNVGAGSQVECCLDCIGNLTQAVTTTCALPFAMAQSPYLLIDLPTMVWDPKNITDDDEVLIRITIYDGEVSDEVCTACADLCSCVVKVGIFGCEKGKPASNSCKFCLPYFTDLDQEGWWSGFALTNSGSSDAVAEVTFYAGGTSQMVTVGVPANSVTTRSLAALGLTTLEGRGGLFAEVKAYTQEGENKYEASMSGFAIMGDGSQAYGYLSKAGYCGCDEKCD